MTNKQVIIDGCDVSGCECYSEHREGYCGWHTPCEGDICPYKLKWALQQLKRKEQECEELKEDKIYLQDRVGKLERAILRRNKQLDQLKAENEELKRQYKELGQCSKALKEYFEKEKETLSNKFLKLKQTLDEIKQILELYANSKVGEEQPDGTYQLSSGIGGSFGFGFCTTTYDPRPARQALQKISEVEDGRN